MSVTVAWMSQKSARKMKFFEYRNRINKVDYETRMGTLYRPSKINSLWRNLKRIKKQPTNSEFPSKLKTNCLLFLDLELQKKNASYEYK